MRACARRLVVWAALAAFGGGACAPTAPDRIRGEDPPSQPGYVLSIVSATPPPFSTIDWREGGTVTRVRVRFERPEAGPAMRLWICLARSTTSFVVSSCRDTTVSAANGEVEGSSSIYRVNDVPATGETRYIFAVLTAGDIVARRRTYEYLDISLDRLSPDVFAWDRVEHVLYWR
jgi:hypothetical protein